MTVSNLLGSASTAALLASAVALALILFVCNHAGVTKKLDELRPLLSTTEIHP